MVIFCWPELFKLNQLGFEWLFEYAELVNLHHKTFSHFKLLGVVIENRRAILLTSIHKRALIIGWVDVSEKLIQHLFISDDLRVKCHLNDLDVSRFTR
ncbi:Uncharacterised protein [Vibrio cholerae]|nr:Uncharacterised protein [Vibrio cholerae]CSD31072.1 Uncharacterised protein [Vibrio cholerae]